MSLACRGSKHYNWKGGIRSTNQKARASAEYNDWRLRVFQRDGFKCQSCEQIGGGLNAHHILSFAKHPLLRFDVSNGITLCKSCHRNLHQKEISKLVS